MFYLEWLLLTGAGLGVSIGFFIWALRSGQFADQGRARYIPLSDAGPQSAAPAPSRLCPEVRVCLFIIGIWLCAMISTLFLLVKG
jgi:cbb3-type cytochrome oxidase maturation protein